MHDRPMPDELFLIDGNSLAYRAFFALPESIATSTGVPTNAIFGFASMLVKILTDYGPKATVVVWDAGDTGRKELRAAAAGCTYTACIRRAWPCRWGRSATCRRRPFPARSSRGNREGWTCSTREAP